MNSEIEKKFLLRKLPEGITSGIKIRQGYLSVGDPEVRVRAMGERFFLTKKSGEGFIRQEEEHEITKEVFEILWLLTENTRIEKTRYEIVAADGLTWEIDEFQDYRTDGLFIAEVELSDELIVPDVPRAIAEVTERDVTDDAAYKNKNLVINKNIR